MADFYSGYNDAGARQERSTLAQLQALTSVQGQAGGMAEQEAKEKARKRGEEFRSTLAALGPNATSEQVMAASRPFLEPDKAATLAQGDISNQRTRDNTRQVALARIAQQNDKLDQDYTLAIAKITDANERRAADDFYKRAKLALQTEAVAQGGDKLFYETGMRRPPVAMPPQTLPGAPANPAIAAAQVTEGDAPNQAAAVQQINSGGGKPMTLEIPSVAAPQAQTPLASPPPGPAVPVPAVAAPADNLDARDLRARGQAAFEAAKAPAAASVAPTEPTMPKFSGSPREIAHQENMWKQAQSKSAGAARLGTGSLETAGWEKLMFGTDPKGMGTASAQQRAQVADERDRIGRALGLSPQEMAMMPYDAKTKQKALGNMINWGAGVAKSQEQLDKSIDLAMEYVDKLGPGRVQMLNKAILAGEKQFNDPDANAYALAVNTVRTEYGRLMTGPTSNAMLPVEAIKKGDQLISNGFDKKSWQEIKSFIGREAKITKESVDNQVNGLRNSLLPKGATPASGPAEQRSEARPESKRVVVDY